MSAREIKILWILPSHFAPWLPLRRSVGRPSFVRSFGLRSYPDKVHWLPSRESARERERERERDRENHWIRTSSLSPLVGKDQFGDSESGGNFLKLLFPIHTLNNKVLRWLDQKCLCKNSKCKIFHLPHCCCLCCWWAHPSSWTVHDLAIRSCTSIPRKLLVFRAVSTSNARERTTYLLIACIRFASLSFIEPKWLVFG